ncbi:MAG: 4'-phosphopantetheinyl transferase superfamily protein [Spirochaetes bacterium]|nr:4'-phosphopantetheinyl transferase superfamily protein [Spirochaetota bacterium]
MDFFNEIAEFLSEKDITFIGTHKKQSIRSLHREERKGITKAVLKRQQDFATGRWCARETIKKMGLKISPLLMGKEGEPLWPRGICGSISHSDGAYCSAGAFLKHHSSLGIDIEEKNRRINDNAAKFILNEDEIEWIRRKGKKKDEYITLIFCAKESVFKLFYPLIKRRFFFSSVSVFPPSINGYFSYIIKKDLSRIFSAGKIFNGYYFIDQNWVFTLCYLNAYDMK